MGADLASMLSVEGDDLRFVIIHDVSKRIEAEQAAHNLAFYDPLTQLANRRLLTDSLQKVMAAAARYQFRGGLMFLDLDSFNRFNFLRLSSIVS